MKKILVAFAIAAFASAASATVAGSSHDLGGTVCGVCHVPHNAPSSVAPLWGRTLPASASYTLEAVATGGTLSSRNSLTCLSCHTDAGTYGTGTTSATTAFTTDLSNDHPIGSNAVLTVGTGYQLPAFTNFALVSGDSIECASCHDVHNESAEVTGTAYKLLRDGQADFCIACHTK